MGARVSIGYDLPDDLIEKGQRIVALGEAFKGLQEGYDIRGEAELTYSESLPPIVQMRLTQDPQTLKSALEYLVNLLKEVPSRVDPPYEPWGRRRQEEKEEFRIAQKVLDSAGYSLEPCRFLFILWYNVLKKD
jgi:hypothetical protein